MNAAAWLGNCIYRGVGTVSGPFHPFGGAVDIIVVEQPDGSFKSSPWYVRFGKFQGVLKNRRNLIKICVNDVEAGFSMYLDHTGQAYFLREGDSAEEEEEELLVYPSLSSGDEADAKSSNFDEIRIPMKSKSCNYDAVTLNSNTGQVVARRSILGFVFGRKSLKENRLTVETEGVDSGMDRRTSIERAEIAADLLETNWSTNIDSRLSFNDKTSRSSDDGEMDTKKKSGGIQEQVQESVDSSFSGDDELRHDKLEDKSVVSSEILRNIDEIPSGVSNNGSIWGTTTTSSDGSPRLQPAEEQCSDTNKALSQCNGIHDEQIGLNRDQSCDSYETPESLLLDSNGANDQTSTLHLNGEINGDINTLAESINMKTSDLLPQDTASGRTVVLGRETPSITLESTNRDVDIYSKCGSAEEVELGSIGTSHGGNSLTDGLDHLIEYMADSQSTHAMSIQHAESSEEELFLFTDLDESKLREVAGLEITYLDAVFKNGKELREQDDTPGEISKDMANPASSPIGINKNNDYGGEEDARLVKSLPNLQYHKSDADHQIPLGRSLESNSRSLNSKDESFSGNLDVEKQNGLVQEQIVHGLANGEQFSKDGPNSMAFKHVLANPEVVEFSLCKHLLHEGMGSEAASQAFDAEKLDASKFSSLAPSVLKNDNLVVRIGGCYFPWEAAASIVLGMVAFGNEKIFEPKGMIAVDRVDSYSETASGGKSWKLWPFTVKKSTIDEKTVDTTKNDVENDGKESGSKVKFVKKMVKAVSPTSEQLASLNLKDGPNSVTFTFSTKMLGTQQVSARIYLWKWNARIVISDVDGTITKSDVLGQFMPLMGVDWSHLGVTHLFSAIKENGYQLLFLSARAISQASLTRQFLINLKQDGKALPDGPVVISPDGLFPSLFREVIRRAPHEFKIACLEDIRALFPLDNNPFYAGFGNRDTDEFSYLKMGIPRGKIFIINPRGEVAVNRRVDTKSYTSLHELVNGMFPATTNISEQEDYNDVNFWKVPAPVMKL